MGGDDILVVLTARSDTYVMIQAPIQVNKFRVLVTKLGLT